METPHSWGQASSSGRLHLHVSRKKPEPQPPQGRTMQFLVSEDRPPLSAPSTPTPAWWAWRHTAAFSHHTAPTTHTHTHTHTTTLQTVPECKPGSQKGGWCHGRLGLEVRPVSWVRDASPPTDRRRGRLAALGCCQRAMRECS